MKRRHFLVSLVSVIAIAVCATVSAAPHESATSDHAGTLVSLKPPYTDWKNNREDPAPRISLQDAVRALCLQAGKTYEFNGSRRNAGPVCQRWVNPVIDERPWEEAMDELLAPFDITYFVRDDSVVLVKPEDLERLRQEARAATSASSDSSHTKSSPLRDAVAGSPLLNANRETARIAKKNNVRFTHVTIVTAVPIILLCIPLLIGKIGMNSLYGIRIPKAFKSEENWNRINRYGAQKLILWFVVYMVIGFLTLFLPPISDKAFIRLILFGPLFIGAIPIIEILLFARKMD